MKLFNAGSRSEDKKRILFVLLVSVFLTNALLAEIIGVKIFSLEKFLNIAPAQIALYRDFILDFNLTAGVLIWPIVFVTTDLINEYFGKESVKKISILAAVLILYSFLAIYITTKLPPADFWQAVNKMDGKGNSFDINYSYSRIFSQGLNIIAGSIIAFLIGQLLDAYVFFYLRKITNTRFLWLRATGSTVISQLIDSFLVLFIAFYLLADQGKWSLGQVFAVGLINYIYKFVVAVLLTPVLYFLHYIIDSYLGDEEAEELIEEAIEE